MNKDVQRQDLGHPIRAFSRSLPMALLRAREAVMGRFRPLLNAHGITEQQWRVLRALYEKNGIDASELADACCLMMPSLTRIMQSMEKDGYIRRRADPNDQRRSLVSITRKGRSMIARIGPYSEQQYADIAAAFGPDNLRRLYEQLEQLMASLEAPRHG